MLTRRHLRIKVMQILYASDGGDQNALISNKKLLAKSVLKMQDLYYTLLALYIEIYNKAHDYQQKSLEKLSISKKIDDASFLINNKVLQYLKNNKQLLNHLEKNKLNPWILDFEYVDILFKSILKSDLYKTYSVNTKFDLQVDKNFFLEVYKNIIVSNEKLYDYIEDKNITWADDFPVVNTIIIKIFNKFKLSVPETFFIQDLFKDDDDEAFAYKLLETTYTQADDFAQTVITNTKNWDSERLAKLDMVLLKMAVCEFLKFPSIPYKVTINEYLEIAKGYSTPKSNIFINGILDKVSKHFQQTQPNLKTGRGLI